MVILKLLQIFINNFTMHISKLYLEVASIAQGSYSSSTLDLFLYYYECSYINNSLHLHRHIDDINLNSIDNNLLNSINISVLFKIN